MGTLRTQVYAIYEQVYAIYGHIKDAIRARIYVVAVRASTQRLAVFGDKPHGAADAVFVCALMYVPWYMCPDMCRCTCAVIHAPLYVPLYMYPCMCP